MFLYPAYPRVFKNMETLCAAARLLREAGLQDFEVRLTIDGTENRYARRIASEFGAVPGVRLLGRQTREAIFALYAEADCLVFPSRLETWGLPITEFKPFGKPLLVADCRYACETVGDYRNAAYFDPDDAVHLATLMRSVIEKNFRPEIRPPAQPAGLCARDWAELFEILLNR